MFDVDSVTLVFWGFRLISVKKHQEMNHFQLKKILGDELQLDSKWENLLCGYITQEPSTMRRHARKLLLLMCDSDMVGCFVSFN